MELPEQYIFLSADYIILDSLVQVYIWKQWQMQLGPMKSVAGFIRSNCSSRS